MKDKSKIPAGHYCYEPIIIKNGKVKFRTCPYWSCNPLHELQENGYCSYLKKGDWEVPLSHLWDKVKECGINMDIDEKDLEL